MRSSVQDRSVVTQGLVLCLDAQNEKSYPGSGTTWFDISGNRNNFTINNSPTFTGKYFNFNGVNQSATAQNSSIGNFGTGGFTIEYVAFIQSASSQAALIFKRRQTTNIGLAGNPGWVDRVGANEFYAQDDNPGAASGDRTNVVSLVATAPINVIPTPFHMVYTVEKNGTQATGSRYLNSVLTTTNRKQFVGTNSVDDSTDLTLMLGTGQFVAGGLSTVRLYNRSLTREEVSQNYAALSGRLNQL